jgi:riboflavin-specific deaminase-like protein
LQRLLPDQRPVTPEEAYASLGLEERAREDRPYVIANMVATVDGRATLAGRTKSISSEADRTLFHVLREQVDAVMAGTATIAIERYGPIVRDPERRERRLERGLAPVPLAVTATRSLELPVQAPLFQDAESRIVVLTSSEREVPPASAQIMVERLSGSEPDLDLVRSMDVLRRTHGVRTLLLEGGPTLLGAMLDAGVVDELFLSVAPLIVGRGAEVAIVEGAALPQPLELDVLSLLEDRGSFFFRYAIGARG